MNTARFALVCSISVGICGCHQTSPSSSSASTVPAEGHKELSNVELYDLREKCARDAREWFKENYPDAEPIPVQGGGTVVDAPSGYENHYSESKNGCYALLHKVFSASGVKNGHNYFIQSSLLWDVNENAQLGAFVVDDVKGVTACNVNGAQCRSKDEWSKLAQPYLSE